MKKNQAGHPSALGLIAFAILLTSIGNAAPASETVALSSSQAKRIAEHPDAFAALPANTQQQIAEGRISRGQNLKLVYLALGRPDRIVTTPDAKTITWTYRNYLSPVIATNKTVVGRETKQNLANGSPLQDTMDAWNNRLVKHEVPDSPQGNDLAKWEPKVIAKAPTQSWADYGKYRLNLQMAEQRPTNTLPEEVVRSVRKNMGKRAEVEYQDSLTIPPISSPDPIQLDVIFVDQSVSDAIVDESFSAFSLHPLTLPGTATPDDEAPISE